MAPLPNGFPADQRASNAAQARLSESGVSFLEENVASVAGLLLPEGGTITVSPSCGDSPMCCSDGTPDMCRIKLDLEPQGGDSPRLEITPQAPSRLDVVLRARVKTLDTLNVTAPIVGSCTVDINTENTGEKSVTVKLQIDFLQDPVTGNTSVSIVPGSVVLENLDNDDVGFGGSFGCGFANIFLKGVVIDQVKDVFVGQVNNLITGQLCKKCEDNGDCAPFGACGDDGICQVQGADPARCVQELGIVGRLAAASLFSGISPGMKGALDLYLAAGGFAETKDGGLSLGLLGGTIGADNKHDACVPVVSPPSIDGIPRSPVFDGNTRPDGQPFHLGIGIHQKFLDKAGWAAFDSGFLCVNLGANAVDLLTSDNLNILFGTVEELIHGEVVPFVVGLRPQNPPTFVLGAGTFDENGKVLEPLLSVTFKELDFDLYAFIDQRYARLATVRTDLSLPIGLDSNELGQLVPVLGDVTTSFTNTTSFNTQLVEDTPEAIAGTFPAILSGVALPAIFDGIGGITLPEVAGLNIKIGKGGITTVDEKTVLAIFTELEPAGSAKRVQPVDTTAEILSIERPDTAGFAAGRRDTVLDRPTVQVRLGGDRDRGALEWQYKIGKGTWSGWVKKTDVTLSTDAFWFQAKHPIWVRARLVDEPTSVDPTPVALTAVIDSVAPIVNLSDEGGSIGIEASDRISRAAELTVRYRLGGGAWRDAGAPPVSVDLDGHDPRDIEVEVADQGGNVGVGSGQLAGFHGQPPPASSGCDCRVGRSGQPPVGASALAVLGLLGVIALRRRKRLALAAAALLAACGGDSTGTPPVDLPDAGTPVYPEDGVKPGALGLFLDMDSADGRTVAVGYEESYGDLVIADVVGEGGLALQPIDGVPDGPVVKNPLGYRKGITEPGDNVGAYASVCLVDGQARAAYQDLGDHSLLYGHEEGEGGWSRHVVDPSPGDGTVLGMYTSISADASGKPGIAYVAHAVPDGNGFKSQLRFAQASDSSPEATTDWEVSVVHELAISCAGLCHPTLVCRAADQQCVTPTSDCAPCGEGQTCVSGVCEATLAPLPYVDLPDGPLFVSADRLQSGEPVVAFYDSTRGDLLVAQRSEGTWTVAPVAVGPETDMGQWSSLVVGPDDTLHIAFQDALADSLRYLSIVGGVVGEIETIDDGVRTDRPHPVGAAIAIYLRGEDVGVVYQDAASADLLHGYKDGAWVHDDLMVGDNNFGFYNAVGVDGDTTWVASFTYDRQKFPPGQVYVKKLP